jgi:hypothetical protein
MTWSLTFSLHEFVPVMSKFEILYQFKDNS